MKFQVASLWLEVIISPTILTTWSRQHFYLMWQIFHLIYYNRCMLVSDQFLLEIIFTSHFVSLQPCLETEFSKKFSPNNPHWEDLHIHVFHRIKFSSYFDKIYTKLSRFLTRFTLYIFHCFVQQLHCSCLSFISKPFNLYHSLGYFSRWQINNIFLIFPRK